MLFDVVHYYTLLLRCVITTLTDLYLIIYPSQYQVANKSNLTDLAAHIRTPVGFHFRYWQMHFNKLADRPYNCYFD